MADNDYSWDNQPGLHKWNRGRMNRENLYGEESNKRYGFGHTGYGDDYNRQRGVRGDHGDSFHDEDRYRRGWAARDRDWREDEYDRRRMSGESMYGGDTRNYGNMNQGGFDADWWERARAKVASWFGADSERNEGPHRGKGPKGYVRSEERIREDVHERLSYDHSIDASEINIQVEGSEVILSGVVHSREEKRRAEDLVETVLGVRDVQNNLRVERVTGHNRDRF
jgi:osmotically-inducible protein OsmY